MMHTCKGIFVTATGTDAGKTFVSALLIRDMRRLGFAAGYYKAVLSGAENRDGRLFAGDAEYVRSAAGLAPPVSRMVSYVYEHAFSPHLAAYLEGNPVELERVMRDYAGACAEYDYMVVEGAGGIVCPLRVDGEKYFMQADIIKALGLEALIVVPSRLGAINEAVLTASYAAGLGIGVRGFLINNFHPGNVMEEDNRVVIERLSGVPVLACVQENAGEIPLTGDLARAIFRDPVKAKA
jgi:dethiobiotin synthetase